MRTKAIFRVAHASWLGYILKSVHFHDCKLTSTLLWQDVSPAPMVILMYELTHENIEDELQQIKIIVYPMMTVTRVISSQRLGKNYPNPDSKTDFCCLCSGKFAID